jgi:hypothetical protein
MDHENFTNLEYIVKKGKFSVVSSCKINQEYVVQLVKIASKYKHIRIMEYLINLYDKIDYNCFYKLALCNYTIYHNDLNDFDLVKILIRKNPQTNVYSDEDILKYIKVSASYKEYDIVKFFLMEFKCDKSNCDDNILMPLYQFALEKENIELVKLLLQKRWKYSFFKDLCSLGMRKGDIELVKFFISKNGKYLDLQTFKDYLWCMSTEMKKYIFFNTSIQNHKGINKKFSNLIVDRRMEINPIITKYIGEDITSIIDEYLFIIYD